jgi:transposase
MAPPSRYPDELRNRAVRLVFEERERSGERRGAITVVAGRLGVPAEALGRWVRRAEAKNRENRGPDSATAGDDAVPPHEGGGVPDASEILAEVHALRSAVEQADKRRKRRMTVSLVIMLALIPLGILAAHIAIDYESGRVAQAIERSSGPFTDEALRRVCRSIKIPLFGPETKKRLGCPPSSETSTTNTTTPEPSTTEPPPATSEPTTSSSP